MKLKKSGVYEASNVTFDTKSMIATSYGWWHFVEVINGKVVFNNINYSNTTCKHQSKVRNLLNELGIKIDLFVQTRTSLSDSNALIDSISTVKAKIEELEESLRNPRRKKALDEERKASINECKSHIKQIEIVMTGSKLKAVLK